MYESFFQLKQRPFAAAPLADRYFPSKAAEAARQTISRCVDRAEGAGLLIGPSGSGKTMLLQVLAEQFRHDFAVALLASGRLTTRRALLQAILYEMSLPYRGLEEGELRLSLIDHLAPSEQCPLGMLLLVDEAHTLPLRLLEELRMITNLIRNGQPRARLVLAGSSELEERLASPKLESFSQRLRARCYLESLEQSETVAFIRSQIAKVGGQPDQLFTHDALVSVHRATDGIPRLINQLCDHALVLAYAGGRHQLSAAGIDEAWADLQQLPSPWNESNRKSVVSADNDDNVIEFGQLDEIDAPSGIPAKDVEIDHGNEFGDAVQPGVRLNQIAAHLAELDEDFQPIGTIGPESELAFSENTDPFSESFADEEVIFDRYASVESVSAPRQRVRSTEGTALSSLLEPFVRGDSPPKLSIALGPSVDETMHPSALTPDSVVHESVAEWVNPAEDPVFPEEAWDVIGTEDHELEESSHSLFDEQAFDEHAAESVQHDSTRHGMLPPAPKVAAIDDADDVMIVEDDPYVPRQERPIVRRQEYAQLFAKLRKG